MTNKEILFKALEKADYNGFNSVKAIGVYFDCQSDYEFYLEKCQETKDYYRYIFSHDFAKAFWGNNELDERGRTLIEAWEKKYRDFGLFSDFDEFEEEPEIYYTIAWEYHLTKMVLCKEPLKYLEKFIDVE